MTKSRAFEFSEIFGGVTGTPTQNRGGANGNIGETLNPWATPPSMFPPVATNSALSSVSKPNPTNPFL